MEILIGLAIILAVNEWRDIKGNNRFKELKDEIEAMKKRQDSLFLMSPEIIEIKNTLAELSAKLDAQAEFINKAHVDLDTIVKEYEINGIPLNLQRGQSFDMVEGL